MFALHRPVDNLVKVAAGGGSLFGGRVAGGELGLRRSLGERSLDD
jgi:hypothetical protein